MARCHVTLVHGDQPNIDFIIGDKLSIDIDENGILLVRNISSIDHEDLPKGETATMIYAKGEWSSVLFVE